MLSWKRCMINENLFMFWCKDQLLLSLCKVWLCLHLAQQPREKKMIDIKTCAWITSDLCIDSLHFSWKIIFSSSVTINATGEDLKALKFTYKMPPLKIIGVFWALQSKILLALQFSSVIAQKFSFYCWKYKLFNTVKHGFYWFSWSLL